MSTSTQSSQAPLDTTSSASSSQEIGALAEKFLASLKRLASLRPTQEDTDRAVESLELLLRAQNFDPSQQMALLDSQVIHIGQPSPTASATRPKEWQFSWRMGVLSI